MKLYKLTRPDGTAYGGTQWAEGVTIKTSGRGKLCGRGYTHWYTHPLLAVLLNPIHAGISDPVLWEGEGEVVKNDCGLKVGCKKATTIRRIPMPQVTTEQRVRFAILCVLAVYHDPEFARWAEAWLSGVDRSAESAQAAQSTMLQIASLEELAAREAALAAEYAAKGEESSAAVDAARAAQDAARAAREAARAASWKESKALLAMEGAARAAEWAVEAQSSINLAALAEQACADEENEK